MGIQVVYDLPVSALMRQTLSRQHREGCCCPTMMRPPVGAPGIDVTLESATRDELESLAACARLSLAMAHGPERNSLHGLVRRAKSGIVWIEERTKRLGLAPDEQRPWATHDPRRDGESWEEAARRVGWVLDQHQQIGYLKLHDITLNDDATGLCRAGATS